MTLGEVLSADRAQQLPVLTNVLYGLAIALFVNLANVAIQSIRLRERLRALWALVRFQDWDMMIFIRRLLCTIFILVCLLIFLLFLLAILGGKGFRFHRRIDV